MYYFLVTVFPYVCSREQFITNVYFALGWAVKLLYNNIT